MNLLVLGQNPGTIYS